MRALGAVAAGLLLALAGGSAEAGFPGRNGRLAFASERGGSALGIFTMGADGRGLRRLTGRPPFGVDPAWSPDGRRIAFDRIAGGTPAVYVASATGGPARRLAAGGEPAW